MTSQQIEQGAALAGVPSFKYLITTSLYASDQSLTFTRAAISACRYMQEGRPTLLAAFACTVWVFT
jgi:hypothetical protein